MTKDKISDQVRGKAIRLTWTDGPTKGSAHDHVFHADGNVEWHAASDDKKPKSADDKPAKKPERAAYSAVRITEDVCLISYLSASGYTLTVTLNFKDGSTVGFASNEKTWTLVKGRFEVLG